MRPVLRWALGSPDGPRSSPWRLWGDDKKGDLYAAVRVLGGAFKMSIHRDGNCFLGFTKDYAPKAAERFARRGRIVEKWQLPAEPVVRVLRVFVPQSELVAAELDDAEGIVWVPAPEEGKLATSVVVVAPPGENLDTPPGAHFVGTVRTRLRDAWVFCVHDELSDEWRGRIAFERERLRKLPAAPGGTRAALWDTGTHHDRAVLELAFPG